MKLRNKIMYNFYGVSFNIVIKLCPLKSYQVASIENTKQNNFVLNLWTCFIFFLQQVIELNPDANKLNYCIYQKPEVSNIIISSFCLHSLLSTPLTFL